MATTTGIHFPATAVQSALRAELIESVRSDASIRGISLPSSSADVARATVDIDSLVVVSILCIVEPLLGFELPQSVVRTGGYESIEVALQHLLPQIEKEWNRQIGVAP